MTHPLFCIKWAASRQTQASFDNKAAADQCSNKFDIELTLHFVWDFKYLAILSDEFYDIEEQALHVGITKLFPPICREIIMLHFAEGLTFREIAERMGVSETTIYKHLRGALNQLRQTLKNAEQ